MKFTDILYGTIEIPDWLKSFLTIPEFVRLRGVRLSNIDSIDLKDFNTPTRWEHCIGAAYLALIYSKINKLSLIDEIHLTLASLLHDIGTPPYAHTVEYILSNFNHEEETYNLISGNVDFSYESSSGGFQKQLLKLIEKTGLELEAEKVAEIVVGDGKYGFLLNGSIDIDNIDNLIRASFYSGIEIDKNVPFELIEWLSGYSNAPTDLDTLNNPAVIKWLRYRNELYKKFYESKNDLGRQAFLQHIIRRAYNAGLSNKPIIYSTDDSLLNKIETYEGKKIEFEGKSYKYSIPYYINKFKLLEEIVLFTSIPIESEKELRILSNPTFANWLELKMFNDTFEPFVLINKKRFKDNSILFDDIIHGEICIYILISSSIWHNVLPNWIKDNIDTKLPNDLLINSVKEVIKNNIKEWIKTKPWHSLDGFRIEDIKSNLEHEKDWSFKSDRNKNIHTYQATFVRTIPNKLISSLGLKGELIIDPFGGTGQTAEEALRLGCQAITSDVNSIAHLATKAKFTYLSKQSRDEIKSVTSESLLSFSEYDIPLFDRIEKWHHKDTLIELSKIKSFINSIGNENVKIFLKTCFSDILTSATERKGKGLSYFADNTPLPREVKNPSYQDATKLFLNKVSINLKTLEGFYSYFERKRRNTENELKNVKVLKADARYVSPEYYGIKEKTAAAVITSPPYLCMVDYTLGQRLSYNWLFSEEFNNDFNLEIGSRRKRNNSEKIYDEYLNDMELFVINTKRLIRKDGYLVTIIGEPKANAFRNFEILSTIENKILNNGYKKIWEIDRPISWHRNHGISSLEKERITIYVLTI